MARAGRLGIGALVLVCISAAAGFGLGRSSMAEFEESRPPQDKRLGQRGLINPLLECDLGNPLMWRRLVSFRPAIDDYITAAKESGRITSASVYYRDLNNGMWFGVDEERPFLPASLLKVPILLDYLREAELKPGVLGEKLKVEVLPRPNVHTHFPSKAQLENGGTYTVGELLRAMIIHSDNNASHALADFSSHRYLRVLEELGLPGAEGQGPRRYPMNVVAYASVFRVLFNGSYLSPGSSEDALKLLTQTDANWGLVAGVPRGVKVAHKFGEASDAGLRQLHDCGIIYYPSKPYLLCVMTRGEDYEALAKAIHEISALAYQGVSSQLAEVKLARP